MQSVPPQSRSRGSTSARTPRSRGRVGRCSAPALSSEQAPAQRQDVSSGRPQQSTPGRPTPDGPAAARRHLLLSLRHAAGRDPRARLGRPGYFPLGGGGCKRAEQRPKADSRAADAGPSLSRSPLTGPIPGRRGAGQGAAERRPSSPEARGRYNTPRTPITPWQPMPDTSSPRCRPEGLTSQQVRERGAAVTRDRVVSLPDVLKQLVDVVPLKRVQACRDVIASPRREGERPRQLGLPLEPRPGTSLAQEP